MFSYVYSYDGPVYVFDELVTWKWHGSTCAPSEEKARSNLAYQFKKQYNKPVNTRVSLPGKIKMAGRKDDIR